MTVSKSNIALGVAALLMGGGWLMTYNNYRDEMQKTRQLEQQVHELNAQVKRSAIIQRISAQMEEIASEQKLISDEQRHEAEQQTELANSERKRAEDALGRAQAAQKAAYESEQRAVEASHLADGQRLLAEEGQRKAEYSRRVADTLSYLSLARSLGNQAVNQQKTGNTELATLLAYASYVYATRYGGDAYQPAIYDALSLLGESSRTWTIGKGSIMKMSWLSPTDFLTASTYGEISYNHLVDGKPVPKMLIADKRYDFRDLLVKENKTFYAVSHTGHLIVGDCHSNLYKTVTFPNFVKPFRLFWWGTDRILITCEKALFVINERSLQIEQYVPFDFKTAIAGEENDDIILFDEQGRMHYYGPGDTSLRTKDTPHRAVITAYNYDQVHHVSAYGTSDGIIYLTDKNGHQQNLVGHRSRVTRLKFDTKNQLLYSTSFDGTVKFWNITSDKIEPVSVLNSTRWIISFVFDNTKQYIWTGDQNGNLTETLIDVPKLSQHVRDRIKRDFTTDEWNYFIGSNVPYESFKRP